MLDRGALTKARGRNRIVKLDDALLRVDKNDERRAGTQTSVDLVVDVNAAIIGRENLNGDVGTSGGISSSSSLNARRRSFATYATLGTSGRRISPGGAA